MPHHFRGQTFDGFLRRIPDGYDGTVFEKCRAQSVIIGSISDTIEFGRCTIRDVQVTQCTANALTVGPIVLENCRFERLKTSRHPAEFQGTAFKNCKFSGPCGRMSIQDASKMAGSFRHWNRQIVEDNDRIYRDVDVAIDISDATFSEFDARGMRGELITVNHENQFVFDYAAVASFLDEPPANAPNDLLGRLDIWRRITNYNFVMHVSPKTRAKKLLQQFEALIALAKANHLLLAPR